VIGIIGGRLGILAGGSIGALAAKLRDSGLGLQEQPARAARQVARPERLRGRDRARGRRRPHAEQLLETLGAAEVVVEEIDSSVATLFEDEQVPEPEREAAATG
jgi:hypothetical protein